MSLNDWLLEGHLRKHSTSSGEIRQMMALYTRDISDSSAQGLSIDTKFAIVYNAALMCARAAMAAAGYRTSGEGNHYWTIQSLRFTVGLGENFIQQFDAFRRKRNTSAYEMTGVISEQEFSEMQEMATLLYEKVTIWLSANFQNLL